MNITLDTRQLNPSQRKFLAARDKFLCLAAGFGTGKTTIGAIKVLQLATENPGVPGLIVARSWTSLKSTILRKLNSLLPRNHQLEIVDQQGERYITLDGSTPIYLRTAHNPALMDGLDVGWIYADEIRHYTKEAYDIMIARRRVKCPFPQCAVTSTPAMHWMAAEYDGDFEDRLTIHASTLENAHNLEPGYVKGLRESYSRAMQKAVIEGLFTVLEGAVYEQFDPSKDSPWLVDYDHRKHPEKRTYLWIDPGYRRPAVLWVREYKPMKWILFKQLMPDNCSTVRLVETINAINAKEGIHIDAVWVDPAADSKEQATEINVMQVIRAIRVRKRNHEKCIYYPGKLYSGIEFGVERCRVMLGDPEIGQEIMMYISRDLHAHERASPREYNNRGIVKCLTAYHYPEAKDGRPIYDLPEKDSLHDHGCDAFRYGTVGLFLTTPLLRKSIYREIGSSKAPLVVSR